MIGRVPILDVQPALDDGKRPAKAVAGETFEVSATIFGEGHDLLGAAVVLVDPAGSRSAPVPMHELAPGTDRLGADVTVTSEGLWQFYVAAWRDPYAQWRHDAEIKVPRGLDTELVLADGALLFARAARAMSVPASRASFRAALQEVAERLTDPDLPPWDRLAAATTPEITAILDAYPLRDRLTRSRRYQVIVHRQRALYGAWYEFFPRSQGAQIDPLGERDPVSGTLRTAALGLDRIAEMGFDVVYLPPVHPIGSTFRKGRNNTLHAQPSDPGSPWAIGSPAGGHDTIHPDLGTFDDFDAFVARATDLGLEVALDLALNASPDHPWVNKHPEWFTIRADGTIAYAENPPKKYQDIYPINFDNDPEGLYAECLRILQHWIRAGVTIFRVDNPHTKPINFWQRLIADIRRSDPDVLFLAEAFTRPAMMHELAKVGFHQSYTYFTWRNEKEELGEYALELARAATHMRPNFFVNTPDILHAYLAHGGPAAFAIRAVLAATLSPTWGVYSGYELYEHQPVREGSEEYLNSEKYQLRPRDFAGAEADGRSLAPLIRSLNTIRRSHPALQQLRDITLHWVETEDMLAFTKRDPGTGDTIIVICAMNPAEARESVVHLDLEAMGLPPGSNFAVTDLLDGEQYMWGEHNYVRLDPATRPAHVLHVQNLPDGA